MPRRSQKKVIHTTTTSSPQDTDMIASGLAAADNHGQHELSSKSPTVTEDRFQTPPVRPTPPPPTNGAKSTTTSLRSARVSPSGARRKIDQVPTPPKLDPDKEEYLRFVHNLTGGGGGVNQKWEDDMVSLPSVQMSFKDIVDDEEEEDEDEFQLTDFESSDDDDDDDDDDDMTADMAQDSHATLTPLHILNQQQQQQHSNSPHDWEQDFYSELEAELGSLLEEDLEAAVTTLLGGPKAPVSEDVNEATTPNANNNNSNNHAIGSPATTPMTASPSTPLRDAARASKTVVTADQVQQLQSLMSKHYQLLLQQSILAVRAANLQKQQKDNHQKNKMQMETSKDFYSGESAEDLADILDGAVGMLQDLDQNRKDAIRNFIQLEAAKAPSSGKRSLLPQLSASENVGGKRLTRSAFTKTLEDQDNRPVRLSRSTTFDVKGLARLKTTFATIDNSGSKDESVIDILESEHHGEPCRLLLQQAGADFDPHFIPGTKDLSELVSDPKEMFGPSFTPPTTELQQIQLRKSRNQFSAAEDNLVFRGVNLYGEKQWLLIADRYLPDRSVNIISQRYSKLCLMLYRAHGIHIDAQGNLETPPQHVTVEDLDEEAIAKLKRVHPPAILNVHRWSIEEDLTLLKAVPLLGHMWAELSTRLIPHRDRGHLRKRYQVLERRVKSTVTRAKRDDISLTPAKPKPASSNSGKKPSAAKASLTGITKLPQVLKQKKGTIVDIGPVPAGKANSVREVPMVREVVPSHTGSAFVRGPLPAHLLCPQPVQGGKSINGVVKLPQGKIVKLRKGLPLPLRGVAPASSGTAASQPSPEPPVNETVEKEEIDKLDIHASFDGPLSLPLPSPSALDSTMDLYKHETTRTGFEKILNECSNDWSQMSRMKKMMENDSESVVANAIVSQLAITGKEIAREKNKEIERLPNIDIDTNTSSGYSMLTNIRDADGFVTSRPSTPRKRYNGSIMAKVLEQTRKSGPEGNNAANGGALENGNHSVGALPTTPSKQPSLSSFGTSAGFSPALRNMYSPTLKVGLSPGVKSFSPAANPLLMNFTNGGASMDGFEFCNFEISDRSRQAFEGSGLTSRQLAGGSIVQLTNLSHPHTPSNNGNLFDDSYSLKPTDLEAISALNSLSNSPARFLLKRASAEMSASGPDKSENKSHSLKKSLFATVVGCVEKKESSKKTRII